MRARKPATLAAVASLALLIGIAGAGSYNSQRFVMFGGSNIDTLENVSPWISVRGANRVVIRTWTSKAAFHVSTDADSSFSDTIATFRVAFTDSVSGTNPLAAGDSVVYTASFLDTTIKMLRFDNHPANQELRGAATGSGVYSFLTAIIPAGTGVYGDGSILPQYMRVYVTPNRRFTAATPLATVPRRTTGLKGLRMEALVITPNK